MKLMSFVAAVTLFGSERPLSFVDGKLVIEGLSAPEVFALAERIEKITSADRDLRRHPETGIMMPPDLAKAFEPDPAEKTVWDHPAVQSFGRALGMAEAPASESQIINAPEFEVPSAYAIAAPQPLPAAEEKLAEPKARQQRKPRAEKSEPPKPEDVAPPAESVVRLGLAPVDPRVPSIEALVDAAKASLRPGDTLSVERDGGPPETFAGGESGAIEVLAPGEALGGPPLPDFLKDDPNDPGDAEDDEAPESERRGTLPDEIPEEVWKAIQFRKIIEWLRQRGCETVPQFVDAIEKIRERVGADLSDADKKKLIIFQATNLEARVQNCVNTLQSIGHW